MADPSGHWPREITLGIATSAHVIAAIKSDTTVGDVAANIATVASTAYIIQTVHYDVRKALNANIPESEGAAKIAEWIGPPDSPSASCHQYTATDGKNVKYVSPDGHREAIYNSKGYLVLDSRDIGTYNFSPSGNPGGTIGHALLDVIPWIIFGNDDDDPGPIINEWNRLFN